MKGCEPHSLVNCTQCADERRLREAIARADKAEHDSALLREQLAVLRDQHKFITAKLNEYIDKTKNAEAKARRLRNSLERLLKGPRP